MKSVQWSSRNGSVKVFQVCDQGCPEYPLPDLKGPLSFTVLFIYWCCLFEN